MEVVCKFVLRKTSDILMLIVPNNKIDLVNPKILEARHGERCDKTRSDKKQRYQQPLFGNGTHA